MAQRPYALLLNPCVLKPDYISLGYICAYARANGFAADVVDLSHRISHRRLLEILTRDDLALVGISSYQATMGEVLEVARLVKAHSNAKVILGGPQTPAMPDDGLAEMDNVDFLCRGEGETVFLALLNALSTGGLIEDVPGISYRDPGGVIRTNTNPPLVADLDDFPSPYLTNVLSPRPDTASHLLTSRGCTFGCAFCVTPFMSNRTIRVHSTDRVLEEITHLYAQGQKSLWIADPLFLFSRKRASEIFERIIASGLELNIWFEARADLVTDDLLTLMKAAGVRRVAFGLESANQDALDLMGKKQALGAFTGAVRRTQQHGIDVELLHMLGMPGDTLETTIRTFDYIRSLGILFTGNSTGQKLAVYFGSTVSRDPEAAGLIVDERARRADYPAYLSAGTHLSTRTLGASEMRKIKLRQDAEVELARVVRLASALADEGFSEAEILSLPLRKIERFRETFDTRRLEWNQAGPHEYVLVTDAGGRTRANAQDLRDVFVDMTYRFRLHLIGDRQCLLLNGTLVDTLTDLLESSALYRGTICFGVDVGCWTHHRSDVEEAVRRFGRRRPGPGDETERSLARMIGLLDLTDDVISIEQMTAIEDELGIDLYPFVRLHGCGGAARLADIAIRLSKMPGYDSGPVFVGLGNRSSEDRLAAMYREPIDGIRLPPLFLVNSGTFLLHKAGRNTKAIFPAGGPDAAVAIAARLVELGT